VNHQTLSRRWVSEPLEGEIAGTPVISSDGNYVFFTRNSFPQTTVPPTAAPTSSTPTSTPTTAPPTTIAPNDTAPVTTGAPTNSTNRHLQVSDETGYFTVLADFINGTVFFEQASDSLVISNPKYGPVEIAHNVTEGMYSNGQGNGNDVIVWHSSGSISPIGETQLFQFPLDQNVTAIDPSTVTTEQLGSKTWTTHAPPVFSEAGEELFIGTSDKKIEGWVDGEMFDIEPNFEVAVGDIPNSLVLSPNENMLFVASGASLDAVSIAKKSVKWNAPADATMPILTKPVLSPDGLYVYFTMGSKLFAKTAVNGSDFWQVDNDDGSFVQADFTVSADGQFLYLVGIRENFLTEYRIASFSEGPENATSPPSHDPDDEDEEVNTIVIAAVLGSLVGVTLLAGAAYWWKNRNIGVKDEDDGLDLDYNYDNAPPSIEMRPSVTTKSAKPQRYKFDPTRV